ASDAVGGAIGKKTPFNASIGPIESVNAQCFLARRQAERHRYEKATLEGTDFDEFTINTKRRLPSNKIPTNSGREARGHAPHPLVTLRKVEIDAGMAARNVKHQIVTLVYDFRCLAGHPSSGNRTACPLATARSIAMVVSRLMRACVAVVCTVAA